jgi:hypothetical protein
MKKTSRRNFGKQITCALAALAVASLVTMSEVRGQDKKPQKSSTPSPQEILTSHDTPPPVTIMDGSFIVEIPKALFDETEGNSGQPKKYKLMVAGKKLYLAHIKVVDGSGEILYRGDFHDPANNLNVIITTTENHEVNFASVGNKFQIETPNGRKLEKTTGLDQPVSSKRLGRFRVKNDAGTSETRLSRISVRKGNFAVWGVDLTDLAPGGADGGKETKVLIWLAETTP